MFKLNALPDKVYESRLPDFKDLAQVLFLEGQAELDKIKLDRYNV